MKHISCIGFLLVSISPLFFSCEHKTEGATKKEPAKTSVVTNASATGSKPQPASSWSIDAEASKVEFIIKNFGMEVKGTFGGLNGTLFFDDKHLDDSRVEGRVEVNTISTGIAKRDADLKGEKYFDTEKNKQIIFKSDHIVHTGNSYKAVGTLTIKGIAQHKDIPFTFEQNGNKGVLKSRFTVDRLDFGVGGSGPIMGDEANVSLNIVVNKK